MGGSGHVLQVVTSSERRGAEIFALDLDRALKARNVPVKTVALARGDSATPPLPISILGRRRFGITTLRRLHLQMRQADHVIAHGSSTVPACAAASLGTRRGYIYRNIGDPATWATTLARRRRVSAYLRRADWVVALWESSADSISDLYGVRRERITVIPNGVPVERFPEVTPETRAAARASLGLGADIPVALALGALSPEKCVGDAMRAVDRIPEVTLIIAGDGPARRELENLAADVAPGRVRFLGTVCYPEKLLAASDVLVLPSRTEGMPGALIEAGFTGIPAVATRVGAVTEVVAHGETGFVVPHGDVAALARGIRDALESRVHLGRAARARCLARFEIGVVADEWHRLLSEMGR